jgi:hypothetical protein
MMQDDPDGLLMLLEQHLSWYPFMELRDIYKLLYQGVMGSEHLINSREEFAQYLASEYASLQPDPSERLLEPIRVDGALFRLNLRPYKAHPLETNQLISSLVKTSQLIKGTRNELLMVWEEFMQLCQHSQINNFDPAALQHFNMRLKELDYPAMHHSEAYEQAYQPAYRLISASFIHRLGLTDAS